MKTIPLFGSLTFLLLIGCDSEPPSVPQAPPAGFSVAGQEGEEPSQASDAEGVRFERFVAEGETFPCFVGPQPEDLRMQGFSHLTFGEDEFVMLSTTTIVEPISPEHGRGAQVLVTSHLDEVFEGLAELPEAGFLEPCLGSGDVDGTLVGTLLTLDRAVAAPTSDPFVFKLHSRLFPQEGTGIFEGVRSAPPLNTLNASLEFDLVEVAPGVLEAIPVRAHWTVDGKLGFD